MAMIRPLLLVVLWLYLGLVALSVAAAIPSALVAPQSVPEAPPMVLLECVRVAGWACV